MATTTACRVCGEAVLPGARFCASCGSPQTVAGGAAPGAFEPPPARRADDLIERLQRATDGDYEIRGEIGRGGMAAVYLAYDLQLNRRVAIKVMHPSLGASEGMTQRFKLEARTAAKLDHPNIVTIYAVREVDHLLFFAMKYIDGRSLGEILQEHPSLDVPVVQSVLQQVARALDYAHDEGVIHRDVKPGNIMIDRRGNAVVTDFGIAKAAESPQLTQTGAVIGTPAYMSPEQCLGRPVTAASDQYSLGVVAYEMLDGSVPFGGSALEIQWSHAKEAPPPLARADCPPALAAAIMRMLEKDPAKRWPALRHITALSPRLSGTEEEAVRARMMELGERPGEPTGAFGVTPISPLPRTRDPRRSGTPAAPQLALTALAPEHPVLEVGASVVLEAAMTDSEGRVVSAAEVHWRSTDPSVATIDDDGTVRGLAPGQVTLVASAGEAVSAVTITVVPASVTAVEVTGPMEGVEVGDRAQLTAVATDRFGGVHPVSFGWSSGDVTIGGVSDSGLFTARAPGSVDVSAEADGVRGTLTVTVVPASVASIVLPEAPSRVVAGDRFTLRATPRDRRGAPLPDRRVAWTSSDPAVATISDEGEVVAHAAGAVTVTSMINGARATMTITVLPVPVATVVVSGMPARVTAGDVFRLAATARDARGRTLEREIAWRSTNEAVAVVARDGTVTARAAGTARITASAAGVDGSVALPVAPRPPVAAPAPAIIPATAPEPLPGPVTESPPAVTATGIYAPAPSTAETMVPPRAAPPLAAAPIEPPAASSPGARAPVGRPRARRTALLAGGGAVAVGLLIWAASQSTSERTTGADSVDVATRARDTSAAPGTVDSLRSAPGPASTPAESIAAPPSTAPPPPPPPLPPAPSSGRSC